MSIPESSIKRLTLFIDSLRDANLAGKSPIISSEASPDSNRDEMKKNDLERYYAKPGEAEWGC
jgi:hypothetical protein